jgi:hypothetical protein
MKLGKKSYLEDKVSYQSSEVEHGRKEAPAIPFS